MMIFAVAEEGRKGEPMDLIERHVALNAVDTIGHIATMPDGDKCIRRSAVKYTLSMLPPAQPEQRWIPVSEKLPEESGYYTVTAHDGVGHRTTFVKYQKKAKSWDLTGARSYWRVIAWMPLPEPYLECNEERRTDDKTNKGSSR